MSDPFNHQPPGSFPAPGQPSFNPPPPPAAPGQPSPTAQTPYGAPTEPYYGAPGATPPGGVPPTDYSPIAGSEPPSRRSRGKMFGALAGVAALIAAGVFAFTQLRSNDSDGGAASADEVGEQFVAALGNEDILGTIDLLLPGERETFRQPMLDLVSELSRLEITDDSADLSSVGGLDITFDDVEVDVDSTNADDVALVSISATSDITIDGRDLPLGDFLIETVFGGDRPEIDEESTGQDFNVTFASVQKGGRWYISLFYSAANAIAGGEDIPAEGLAAVGADSPEGALENLVQYTSNLDLQNILASLNPNEFEALQRYAPLFIDDAQDALDEIDIAWEISDTTYTVSGSGDRRQVAIDGFHFEAQVEGETVEFDWADGCLIGTTNAGDFDSCTALNEADSSIDSYLEDLGVDESEPVRTMLTDLGEAFEDFSLQGVVVDKVDGAWYVSPIGTGSETFLSILRALDRDEIETIINDIQYVLDAGMGGFEIPEVDMPEVDFPDDTVVDTIPDDTVTDDTATDDTATDDTVPIPTPDDTVTDDTVTDDTVTDDSFEESSYWFDCLYEFEDEASVTNCIQAGVDDGTFDVEFIPAPYLFPECGLFDYYNADELYTDDAATFLATIEPGRQCIVDAAAAAGIDILYSSPEFLYPECYTQDNPWNYSEENEVPGFECAYAAD